MGYGAWFADKSNTFNIDWSNGLKRITFEIGFNSLRKRFIVCDGSLLVVPIIKAYREE